MIENKMLKNAGLLIEIELKFHIDIPEDIQRINYAFKKANQTIFLVGGCVRDALLGIKPKDFDITTSVHPSDVIKILNSAKIHNLSIGATFGVIVAIVNGTEFEIATFREDDYSDGDGRRPTSVKYSDMLGDSKRRDAKINALYYNIENETIIDLVGGIEDIKNKRVTPVGNPFDRIGEDKLRSLRYIRFSNRFGSELDDETKQSIKHFNDLTGVSNERVRDEFLKGLKTAIKPEKYLEDYKNFGLLPRVFSNATLDTQFVPGLRDPILIMTKMLYPNQVDKAIKTIENLTASNDEKSNVKFLLSLATRFKDLDRFSFVPEIDGKWVMGLQQSRFVQNRNLTNDQIMQWTDIKGLNKTAVQKLIGHKLPYSASDFPDMPPGKALGDAIAKANGESFIQGL